jgi:hypothetical protein
MDADHPYELLTDAGDGHIVEIPIHWALDDWEQYCYLPDLFGAGLIESPAKARELWSLELEAMSSAGGCFVLTAHPFLSGRPSRTLALESIVEQAVSTSGVWVATMADIARHTRAQGLEPRSITEPTL